MRQPALVLGLVDGPRFDDEPQDGALAAVTKRVKESFDPKGVLNPGRMWAGV